MDDPVLTELRRLNESVSDLVAVIHATAYPTIKTLVLSEFGDSDTDKGTSKLKRQVYSLSDGKNSSRDIEKILGGTIRFQAIARYQQQWRRQGLAAAFGPQGKTKAAFDLEDFGLGGSLPVSKPSPESHPAVSTEGESTHGGSE